MKLRRGDVVTVADKAGQFTGKPRPAVVVQANAFMERTTVTICPLTSVRADAPLFRIQLDPSDELPLDHQSWVEVDLITTVRQNRVSQKPIGRMASDDLVRLNASLAVFLGVG